MPLTRRINQDSRLGVVKSTALAASLFIGGSYGGAVASDATVVNLTQVNCQFVESEAGINHGFSSSNKADCEAINAKSGDERISDAQALTLKPGKYIFRVTNQSVDYPLGFWLRGDGVVNRTLLPSVSGGGLEKGVTKDYVVELKEGEYVYSCPLNSTPDYKLNVAS